MARTWSLVTGNVPKDGGTISLTGTLDRLECRAPSLELGPQRGQEADQPLLGLRMMMAAGRVEVRHRRVRDRLDGV